MISSHSECFVFRGPERSLDSSNYVFFNPIGKPGCTVMAGSSAAHNSLGSQVACRLALEHFSQALLDYFSRHDPTQQQDDCSVAAIENAFREANQSVYRFGHSLAAGGRLAAVFMSLVYIPTADGGASFCVGRVGNGAAYLLRDGSLFPFFEGGPEGENQESENYLGTNSLVSVDIANVPVEPGDRVFLFSEPLSLLAVSDLEGLVSEPHVPSMSELSKVLFDEPAQVGFSFSLQVGAHTVFLPASARI